MSNPDEFTSNEKVDAAQATSPSFRRWIWWFTLVIVVVVACPPFVRCVAKYGNLTPLIRFGSDFETTVVPAIRAQPHYTHKGQGFDGQFYVQLATDPLLLRPETAAALDNVTVRGRRLLWPALTWLLSGGGQAWLVLWVYPLLNLFAWIALVVMTWRILRPQGSTVAPAAFIMVVLGPGVVESVSRALPDLPSYILALISLGMPLAGGALLLGMATLGRETMLLAWPSRVDGFAEWKTNWRRWLLDGVLVVVPFALWLIILHLRFETGQRDDGGNMGLPFSGIIARMREIVASLSAQPVKSLSDLILHPALQCCMLIVSLLVQLIFLLRRPLWHDVLWRWGVLTGLLSLFISWVTWEAFYSITRHMLPLHMAFNLLLVRSKSRGQWWWLILGNFYVLPRVLYWIAYP